MTQYGATEVTDMYSVYYNKSHVPNNYTYWLVSMYH